MPKVMKIQGAERAGQSAETGHVHARAEEKNGSLRCLYVIADGVSESRSGASQPGEE